jgi:hypothetical protein
VAVDYKPVEAEVIGHCFDVAHNINDPAPWHRRRDAIPGTLDAD